MDDTRIQLYSIFHLNLAYSSIEEEQRPDVIKKCYWPLLNLARKYNLPFGIEASAYTLESVAALDPAWIDELRDLTANGPCEFIGSGYSQLIGPIVPAEVNAANLRIGNKTYRTLLGFVPEVAFINEQAYSSGLVKHYLDASYKAIIMEWENPFRYHREWNPEWRYHPQYACDLQGNRIPLIWNLSIAFQKFQRYVHGEIDLPEYAEYLVGHSAQQMRQFSLYGNDIEIFNFRPGRYQTEARLEYDEWERIEKLFVMLLKNKMLKFIPPKKVLDFLSVSGAGNQLHLEAPQQPIPVKKQGKYNVSRWAVTGKNNVYANTSCWQIYSYYKETDCQDEEAWRELCYLWSSDFRTHITLKRWMGYVERLKGAMGNIEPKKIASQKITNPDERNNHGNNPQKIQQNKHLITIETDAIKLQLNRRRGLAIESLMFKTSSNIPAICTIPHGYYQDIRYGADFFSGHLIIESPGQSKITDLVPVDSHIEEDSATISVKAIISTSVGKIHKKICISKKEPVLELHYAFQDFIIPKGSFRLGFITLNPQLFDADSLYFSTCNGGYTPEKFFIGKRDFDHGSPVSFLVSASQGIGMTDGKIVIGDSARSIAIDVDMSLSVPIGLVSYNTVDDQYFFRIGFSLGEMDETVGNEGHPNDWLPRFVMRIRTA